MSSATSAQKIRPKANGREFIPFSKEKVKGKILTTKDFEVTARSCESKLPRLFDGSSSTIYQTDASCPHTITFKFKIPRFLSYLSLYRGTDGSYTPHKIRIKCVLATGKNVPEAKYKIPLVDGWAHFPLPFEALREIEFAVMKNHQHGCDSKLRQIVLTVGIPPLPVPYVPRHSTMLKCDLFPQDQGMITIFAEGDPTVRTEVPKLPLFLNFPGLVKDPEVQEVCVPYPSCLIEAIRCFLCDDKNGIKKAIVDLKPTPKGTPLYCPKVVYDDMGGLAVLHLIAEAMNSGTLMSVCEDMLVSFVCNTANSDELAEDADQEEPVGSEPLIRSRTIGWLCGRSERMSRLLMSTMASQGGATSNASNMSLLSTQQLQGLFEAMVLQQTKGKTPRSGRR